MVFHHRGTEDTEEKHRWPADILHWELSLRDGFSHRGICCSDAGRKKLEEKADPSRAEALS
jgi:hypothetical protein